MKEFLSKLDEAKVKLGIRIATVVVMACFFFPFFTVSCDMQTIEMTGADIAKGMGEYVSPHPIVYGVLVLSVIVLAATFVAAAKPWRKLLGLVCGVAGLVLMALIHNGFVDAMKEVGASAEEIAEYTSTEFGFWGCVLGYLAIGAFSWLYGYYTVKEEKTVPAASGVGALSIIKTDTAPPVVKPDSTLPVTKKKTCPCCGNTQTASKSECEKCGYRFIVI